MSKPEKQTKRVRKAKRSKSYLVRNRISIILVAAGIFFLSISILWNLNQTIQLTFFTPKVVPVKNINPAKMKYSIPTAIDIDRIYLHLSVAETVITDGRWQIAENGASHLAISARPGEQGPIIMYAHNTDDKFGPIRWLKTGDKIRIKTQDGKSHEYKVTRTFDAEPNRIDIFTKIKDESLVLYTCDGFADLQRFILIARP